jgi:hypothetical protein
MLGTLCGVRQQCVDVLFFHGGVPISAPKSPTAITAVLTAAAGVDRFRRVLLPHAQ